MSLKTLYATFVRNFTIQLRAYPKDFFIGSLLSAIYTSVSAFFMYHLLFKGNIKQSFIDYSGTADYISYIIIGYCTYRFMVRTLLNVSRSLITELREGTLESLMLAPFQRVQYFIGNMLQQTITVTGETVIMILICLPFGLKFGRLDILSTVISLLLSFYSYFSISLILAAVMLYTRDTYISQNTLFSLFFLICGVTFPIEYLPASIQWLSKGIPVTYTLEIIRNSTLLGMGVADQVSSFLQLFLMSTIYCAVGFLLIKKVETIALEKIFG